MVEDKSVEEIESLRKEISAQVESGEAMDVDYWSAVLSLLRLASFKATLKTEQARLMKKSDIDVFVASLFYSRNNADLKRNSSVWPPFLLESGTPRQMQWKESSVLSRLFDPRFQIGIS